MINRKENRDYKKGVSKYYPTTMQEALNRIYEIVPVKNSYGDYSSGRVTFPKILNGKKIKIKIVNSK
jgi:hypothetical protein